MYNFKAGANIRFFLFLKAGYIKNVRQIILGLPDIVFELSKKN